MADKWILEQRMPDGRPDGWYAGQNEKYYDMFNYTPEKTSAKKFDTEEEAQRKADKLNKAGYAFIVVKEVGYGSK